MSSIPISFDWSPLGSRAERSAGSTGDVYQAPTLISRDGVHPSNPRAFADYSEAALRHNGFALRNYLTLLACAEVIEKVLQPGN